MSLKERLKEIVSSGWNAYMKDDSSVDIAEIIREMVFKTFLNATEPMAISDLDSGIYVDVNKTFLEVLGYSKDEIIGHTSDDIHVFADITDSNKYILLLSRFKKVSEFQVNLKKKNGTKQAFLFSAEKIRIENNSYLLTTYSTLDTPKNNLARTKNDLVIEEIFETISSYLALFSLSADNRFLVRDLSHQVEIIEHTRRKDMVGKYIDDTILSKRSNLLELLNHLRKTGKPHKLAVSPNGDDSEGFYMGFVLSNNDFAITWEQGQLQDLVDKNRRRSGTIPEMYSDLVPEMVFEMDLSGKIIYANEKGIDYFGYTRIDLEAGISISDIFPAEELQRVMENLNKLKNKEATTNSRYLAWKKNKTLIPIVARTFGLFQDGILKGYKGFVADISNQVKFENQIIREKAFLENLVDSTPEAIVITDIPGKITLINKEFTNLFGYTSEEAIDKYIDDLVVPEELMDEGIEIDSLALENRKVTRQTIRKDKFDNRMHVSLIASTIMINGVTVALLGIYRDNRTERKNQLIQEILFNISTAALKQFDIRDIYPTIVSELGKIWDTNNFYIALYDRVSNTISLPFFSDEKDSFNELPAKGTITSWVIAHNKSVLLKENDMKHMEEAGEIDMVGTPCKVWMGVPLRVDDELIGVIVLQDYHDENKFSSDDLNVLDFIANQIATAIQRKTMLDDLMLARQKAEQAAISKQVFMSTMSHEIRTPLNEVIGIANLLMQGDPREDQMDLIKTLRFSGNHLISLVNDVLDYNKMESGKIVFEQTQFNLMDFLEEINRSYKLRAKEKKLDFDILKEGNLPEQVIGDQIRLNQVLSNLLTNALKFTLNGEIKVYVRELDRNGNQSNLEFRISDTGIGIPKDKLAEVFDSFTQASSDTTRKFGGTGLGLAICKKLIELQGGSIKVESEQGSGSTFTFNLFFMASEHQTQAGITKIPETHKGLEGKRILVAEDNKINFFVVNKFLVGWGMIVTHVENGQLAVEMINKEPFNLVLMDLHMPIMDGIEATRIIRNSEKPEIRNIPIVALTAAIMSESYGKIEDLHINEYVLKPFKPQDLYDRLLNHSR
jgi:PAS domain S-box-containing protein